MSAESVIPVQCLQYPSMKNAIAFVAFGEIIILIMHGEDKVLWGSI